MNKQQRIKGAAQPMQSAAARIGPDFEAAHIFSRPGLAILDRHIVILTTAMVQGRFAQLEAALPAALKDGLKPEAVTETIIHTLLYTGTARMQTALDLACTAIAAAGLSVDISPLPMAIKPVHRSEGERIKAQLHGPRSTNGHANPDNRFASALYDLATDMGYGHIWARPGLALRERLICAVAAFTALPDAEPSFQKFAQAAADNGLSTLEIQEIVIQTVPAIGFPRALKALMIMEEIF